MLRVMYVNLRMTNFWAITVCIFLLSCGCAGLREHSGENARRYAETRDLAVARCAGGGGDLRGIIEMSDDWWVEGAENRAHGDALIGLQRKYPEEFGRALEGARARSSAEVLMDAAREGAEFMVVPDIIVLERGGMPVSGGVSIDLGL